MYSKVEKSENLTIDLLKLVIYTHRVPWSFFFTLLSWPSSPRIKSPTEKKINGNANVNVVREDYVSKRQEVEFRSTVFYTRNLRSVKGLPLLRVCSLKTVNNKRDNARKRIKTRLIKTVHSLLECIVKY